MTSRPPASTAALVLFIAFACNMLGRGVADSFMVFVLPLSGQFGWTRAQVSSVYSAFLVVTGLAAPLTGMLIDRWGPRVVYPLGVVLLATASLLAAHLTKLWQFQLVIGLIAGLGVSMLGMVPASMLISLWFRERMSTAMGVAYAGFGTGTIVIVPVVQRSIEALGWRETYSWMGGLTLAALPLLLLLPWRRIAGEARAKPRSSVEGPGARNPLAQALRTREYWQIVQLFTFTSLTTFSVITQVVPFLVQAGLTPLEAAAAFGTAGLLSVFGIMSAGWSGDRFGYRTTVTVTFVGSFVGIAALMAMTVAPARWLVVAFIVGFGLAQGARGPIVSSLAAKYFGGAGFATIYGTMFACMSMGGALGTFIAGLLYDATGGYRAGFVFSMVCVLFAVAPFWVPRALGTRPGRPA
ncbi:MAG TPA: MFS transporter [Usitatibacter sp.]|nr:MFS transporter [Usitatibacter sp.]